MQPRFAKPAGCSGCSLSASGFGYAPPVGPPDARLRAVGEALGYEEGIHGEPFYGSAGGVLSRVFQRAGVDRRQVAIANVVSCRPPNDYLVGAPWEEHAIGQCRQYLQPFLDQPPDNGVVMPLGATALASVLNLRGHLGINVKDFHGTVSRDPTDRFWVVPTFHPSHLQRGAMNLLEVVTQDVALAHRISQRGFQRSPATLVVDPHPDWLARWVDDHLAKVAADPESVHLALDTEFDEKGAGIDEAEVVIELGSNSTITRVNGSNDGVTGWTVPYRQPWIGLIERLLAGVGAVNGWIWLWNKYADLLKLQAAGHTLTAQFVDAMWLAHYLQSDIPRGLGFWAAMASDFGPWKHWAKIKDLEGKYAAADGVQTWRTAMWLLKSAIRNRIWETFLTDWHERDQYVLRPSHEMGVPVNRVALEAFHQELQGKLANVLVRMKQTAAEGVLKPKAGYAKAPKGKPCPVCNGVEALVYPITHPMFEGKIPEGHTEGTTYHCGYCLSWGVLQPTPPASILGKPKKGGGEAKSQYMLEGVKLVERTIEVEIRVCETCGATDVGARHRCPVPKKPRSTKRKKSADGSGDLGRMADVAGAEAPPLDHPVARIVHARANQVRYFWQLPFNPDAPAQVLAYLASQNIAAPTDKHGKTTTAKKEIAKLRDQHRDDPFFQLQLDWKAVQKVDATYAVGSLNRLDANDRLHPEILPKPSTFRDSCQNPNLQNVVADKSGPEGLASGFRKCIEARDGVPPGVTDVEFAAWAAKWGQA